MIEPVLIDTGPLVAILYEKDAHHERCVEQLNALRRAPLTCWPVITEASYLLRRVGGSLDELFRMVACGELRIANLGEEPAEWLRGFLKRYASARVDVADAALVYLAERDGIKMIFTLDRRDFAIYRTNEGDALQIIPEA